MDNVKSDLFYLEKLREDLKFIVVHTKDLSLEELGRNEILLDSMLFRLIQVSESSRKLSDKFKEASPDIPWKAVFGLRNRIVHDYGSVDLGIVYSTLKNDIPKLLDILSSRFSKE